MKFIIKSIIIFICAGFCILAVLNSYKPQDDKYKDYIKQYNACIAVQKEIEGAILGYGPEKSIFSDVRSDKDFEQVEKELINSKNLSRDYKNKSKDCFYVINNGNIYCIRHSDVNKIKKHIESVESLVKRNNIDKFFDLMIVSIGILIFAEGLFDKFGKKK